MTYAHRSDVRAILAAWEATGSVTDAQLRTLVDLTDASAREELFRAARRVREREFGKDIFAYGFVYFSTYCRNACRFCYFRKANPESMRYRRTEEETVRAAVALKESGVHLIDLTMGEDPYFLSSGEAGYARLVHLVSAVKEATQLPVMISPGVVPAELLPRLRAAGADWYALYQETHTRRLYEKLREGQPYDVRWKAKCAAARAGLLVEEGLMTGLGETADDLVHSLRAMAALDASQVRVMTFVPQAGTPLGGLVPQDSRRERNLIAVMRLLMPDRLSPASLDVEGADGLESRIEAGANVVTSIIPPDAGLAGVAQSEMDIGDGRRTVAGVRPRLEAMGLHLAEPAAYAAWVQAREGAQTHAHEEASA